MRKIVATTLLGLTSTGFLQAQGPGMQEKAITLTRMIELKHYSPRPIDDSFSLHLFNKIIMDADEQNIFFILPEIKQLETYKFRLGDELRGKSWHFFDLFTALFKNALVRADSLITRLIQQPFDYNTAETITLSNRPGFNFVPDIKALSQRWQRELRWQVLGYIYSFPEEDSSGKNSFRDILASKESLAREKIKQNQLKGIEHLLSDPVKFNQVVAGIYLNSIATCFDPHTDYFSPEGEEKLQSHLSSETLSFGITLDEKEDGKIIIDNLVPGGPGWKSGEIRKGDELLSLQWQGKEIQDMAGLSAEDAMSILEEPDHDKLSFKLRRADGSLHMASLVKEKIENEENIVKSFVLQGDKKIGYILLPGFYTEWENESGTGCANDVAKEIIKLKKENIDGLILDLRFNGGGSVGEALGLTGIFIDEGTICTQKNKEGKQVALRDPNRGTIYDGPLLVMVNSESASASELVSAALQDYNRAIIAGSTTYGKGTMQQMFSLDTVSTEARPAPGKEMVKITAGKIYRVTGKTTQFTGVVPDIALPDAFDGLEYREKFSPGALLPDTARRNSYYFPLPALPLKELQARSTARIDTNKVFTLVKKLIAEEKTALTSGSWTIPLQADQFAAYMKQHEKDLDFSFLETYATGRFKAGNHAQDKLLMQNNPYAVEVNNTMIKNISSDIYIEECFSILLDMINLQQHK